MRRVGRWAMLLAAAALPALGCGALKRPYAHDPLLRDGYGVWGDPARSRVRDHRPIPEPTAPRPPTLGNLPNPEWESK